MSDSGAAPVAEVVRSGLVESRHRGSVVALEADGSIAFAVGVVDRPMYPRSANKPAQAAGMAALGLDLDGELLALAAASHSGEAFHQEGARRILAGAGLDESALQNTPGWPIDTAAMAEHARAGLDPSSLAADCSGKHAGMLATCIANDWPTTTYLDTDHPLQRALHDTVADLTGDAVPHVGVDGCGAPVFATTLTGLARMFRVMALAEPGSPQRRVVAAIQQHPEWTSGTRRDEVQLIRGIPGLYGKAGAEAVYAVALDDGRAVALKVEDAAARVRAPLMAAALQRLGLDAPVLDEHRHAPVLGGGLPVGELVVKLDGGS